MRQEQLATHIFRYVLFAENCVDDLAGLFHTNSFTCNIIVFRWDMTIGSHTVIITAQNTKLQDNRYYIYRFVDAADATMGFSFLAFVTNPVTDNVSPT